MNSRQGILDSGGPNGNPRWSSDSRQIAYVTANGAQFYYYANRHLAIIPADGGTPQVLTADFDEAANLSAWGPNGIYFTSLQKTAHNIFLLDPATRNVRRVSSPARFSASGPTFTKDFRTMAATGAAPTASPKSSPRPSPTSPRASSPMSQRSTRTTASLPAKSSNGRPPAAP